jgi:hypothetical protein
MSRMVSRSYGGSDREFVTVVDGPASSAKFTDMTVERSKPDTVLVAYVVTVLSTFTVRSRYFVPHTRSQR